jgi:hypothetical protein
MASKATKVRGLTIELGGDATGLLRAVDKVNKEIVDTQKQLKDVNKLLKLDPGNTELLAQKQRLLSEAVREQLRQEGYADWEMEEVARRAPTGRKIRSPAAYLRKAMEYNRKSRAGTPGRDYSMRPESEYEWTERPEDMIRRLQDEMGG